NHIHRLRRRQQPQRPWQAAAQNGGPMFLHMHLPAFHRRRDAMKGRYGDERAFRDMTRSRLESQHTIRSETITDAIHELFKPEPSLTPLVETFLLGRKRIDGNAGKRDRFYAEARIEIVTESTKL